MPNETFIKLLESSAKRMKEDLTEKLIKHPGELGSSREEVFKKFLSKYLPKKFEVSTGFVFDHTGSISKQIDILIVDALNCPFFETSGGVRLYPCEMVLAAGEIKSNIHSEEVLIEAIQKIESVKKLDRSADNNNISVSLHQEIDQHENHLDQIFGFIICIDRVLESNTVLSFMMEYVTKTDVSIWPNIIYAIDKYILTYCCDHGVCPNTMHARAIAIASNEDTELLMRFFNMLLQVIQVTSSASFPFSMYSTANDDWNAQVYYCTHSDPPPFLHDL